MFQCIFLCTVGILLPLVGTTVGSASVWFVPGGGRRKIRTVLYGFAAGVMLASLVWSLLIPSLESVPSPLPAVVGFLSGNLFFVLCDFLFEKITVKGDFEGTKKMIFAVTLHNLPEGMAVGVALAGALGGHGMESAMLLSVGIALQNLPEGSIISAPLSAGGMKKRSAFGVGVLSGVIEPVGALLSLWMTGLVKGLLPFVLSFAAGAMLYVAADELIPDLSAGEGKKQGLLALAAGFALMMSMDVIFG